MATPSGTIFDTGVTQYFIPELCKMAFS